MRWWRTSRPTAAACRCCCGSTLKLNARLLGWNVDRRFGRALDGLMLVDLVDVPRPILARYLGKDGAAAFLAAHGIERLQMRGEE